MPTKRQRFDSIHVQKVILKVTKGKKTNTYTAGTKVRFMRKIHGSSWDKCYIKVLYGKQTDVHGKKAQFYNDGETHNKEDAIKMFQAFTE